MLFLQNYLGGISGDEKVMTVEKKESHVEKKGEFEMRVAEEFKPKIPYPTALTKHRSKDKMRKFIDIFKQLYINLPLCDILLQVLKYAKFLKEMLSKKKKLDEASTMKVGEECLDNFVNKEKLPQKLNDPGSFSYSLHYW